MSGAPCGHTHPPASDTHGIASLVVGAYRTAGEAEVNLLADEGPALRVVLPTDTTVRVDAWTGHRSRSGRDDEDTYRAFVLDGRLGGCCVLIDDRGAPRLGESQGLVTLGLPSVFVRLHDSAPDERRAWLRRLRETGPDGAGPVGR